MGTAIVRRPVEEAALHAASSQRVSQVPPVSRLADLLIVARATGDRFGARHFSAMLDRALAGAS